VFICFVFGDTYELAWMLHHVFSDMFDVNEKPLAWRYINNAKGSNTNEYRGIYLKDVFYLALHRPKPKLTHQGQQGVATRDGFGPHLGYDALLNAIEMGLEIDL
jgi:hypothetical protein